jgi:hypothetical protein
MEDKERVPGEENVRMSEELDGESVRRTAGVLA